MNKSYYSRLLFWVILLGLSLRLYKIDLPMLDKKPQRELYTAEITRNIYFNNFDILHPMMKTVYSEPPGYMFSEFPVYNFLTALFYYITGGIHEIWGKLISVIASVGTVYFFYKFITIYFGNKVAIWAAIFYFLISPQSVVISRNHQPDQLSMFFAISGLYYFSLWIRKEKTRNYIISYVLITLMFLIKLTMFPVLFPMLGLAFHKWGKRTFKKPLIYFFITTLIPFAIWTVYVIFMHNKYPQTLSRGGFFTIGEWVTLENLLNIHWYINLFYDFINEVITIPVLLLTFIGFFIKKIKFGWILNLWIIGLIIYIVLFSDKIYVWYYQVLLLFPLVVYAAITVSLISTNLLKHIKYPNLLSVGVVILIIIITGKTYMLRYYQIAPVFSHVLELAQELKIITPQNGKIIVSLKTGQNDPLSYYARRKDVWISNLVINDNQCLGKCTIDGLEFFRKWGAVYYAILDKNTFSENPIFYSYLKESYSVFKETADYIIFDICQKTN